MPTPFISLEVLEKTFPKSYPEDLILTDKNDLEAMDGTEALRGKEWTKAWDVLVADFDMPYWLTPEAFHYYFPGYILATQTDFKKSFLAVSFAIKMFLPRDVENLKEWAELRWSLFTETQWNLVMSWLDWLESQAMDHPHFIEEIALAKENIKQIREEA